MGARTAKIVAAYDVLFLGFLIWLVWPFARGWGFFSVVQAADPVAGILPLVVPWSGAIGGLTVSLVGAAKHSHDWNHKWDVWHACRPVVGAVAGTVAFVIVVLVLRSAGGLEEGDAVPTDADALALFATIAFAAGFRDRVFFDLIAKVLKVILANGDEKDEKVAVSLDIKELDFGTHPVKEMPKQQRVRVTVTGGEDVTLDDWYTLESGTDAFSAASPDPVRLRSSYRDIVVTFAPTEAGTFEGRVRVSIAGQVHFVALHGTAV